MNNKFISIVLAFSMLFSRTSNAENIAISPDPKNVPSQGTSVTLPPVPTPLNNELDVGAAISPMKKGQVAPFTGLLLSPAAVASIMSDLNEKDRLIRLEVSKAVAEVNAKNDHQIELIKSRNETDLKIKDLIIENQKSDLSRLDDQLKKERENKPDPFFWTMVGIGAGVAISTLTASIIIVVHNKSQ